METRRWRQIKSIFEGASSRKGVERDRFLEESCGGDTALREEVESLLKAHEQSEELFAENAPMLTAQWMVEELAAGEAPSSLHPWRIVKEIGRGGMSVVYLVERADGQFVKSAALKILGFGIFGDDVRRRFLGERQILANLDHPNIVRLLDGGVTEDGRPWLVMDYVDGELLTEHVQRAHLSVDDRLKLFLTICDAVSYAHKRSIIHRDLKPSNLMVTREGIPKLLDFGIAKVLQAERTAETTQAERRFFTLEYASPEQARGEPTGPASDIYSLGLILFRLICDRHPYDIAGLTPYQAVQTICEESPDLESVPAGLKVILGRALEKQPSLRYADVNLLGADIHRHLDGLPITAPPRALRSRKYVKRVPLALGLSAALASVLAFIAHGIGQRTEPMPALEQITFDSGWTGAPALSRDGRLLAYCSDRGEQGTLAIWLQNLEAKTGPVQLTSHVANDLTPDFAPDGKSIVFRSTRDGGGIYVIPVSGGVERKITNEGFSPRFSPDGVWIAYSAVEDSGNSEVFVVPAAGGKPKRLGPNTKNAQYPLWTPDGKGVLFLGAAENSEYYDWWIAEVPGGGDPTLAIRTGASDWLKKRGMASDAWTAPGDWFGDQIVFAAGNDAPGRSTTLWQMPFSFQRWRVTGLPTPLIAGPNLAQSLRIGRTVSGRPVLLFNTIDRMAYLWRLPLDKKLGTPRGPLEQVTQDASMLGGLLGTRARFSTDGRKLIFPSERSGNRNVWMRDMATGAESPLTSRAEFEDRPVLSRSGAYVAYIRVHGSRKFIHISDLRNGEARRLCDDCGEPTDWSFDDSRILCLQSGALFWLDAATGHRTEIPFPPGHEVYDSNISADGKWLALVTGINGKKGLYGFVAPLRETLLNASEWIAIAEEPYQMVLHWAPSGNLLYYFQTTDGFRCLYARRLDPVTKRPTGSPIAIQHFHRNQRYPLNGSWVSVAPGMLVMNLVDRQANIWMATLPH